MHRIDTEGIKSLHIWVILKYNPVRWLSQPLLSEHRNFDEYFSYLSENYMVPIKGIRVDGSPYDRLSQLLLILTQRDNIVNDKFYLVECEIPEDFVETTTSVLMPYLATDWIRSVNELEKISSNGNYFKYNCIVLHEDEYKSLLSGTSCLEFDADNLQGVIDRVNKLTDPAVAYNYYVSNLDLLKSIMVRCQDFSESSSVFICMREFLVSDIKKGEYLAFSGRRKEYLDANPLETYKYYWELHRKNEEVTKENYNIDLDNIPDYIKHANKMLKERKKEEEIEKEKERIRKEKEEIARKKRYYGPNADKVDDRVRQNQNSIGWWARWVANKVTFGRVRPPKTLRSDDYRDNFIKRNPGIFINGFYFCIYCGKPIRAKASDRNKKMFVDHIKPINQGGRNNTWNLGPACWKCNSDKSDKGGEWVIQGYFGKVGFTVLQSISNISKTLLFGYKEKSLIKKGLSIGFYCYTGLWVFQLLRLFI